MPTAHCRSELAPGGVPTMVVNDDMGFLDECGALRFFASKLAPTEKRIDPGTSFCSAFDQALDLPAHKTRGRTQVLRSG